MKPKTNVAMIYSYKSLAFVLCGLVAVSCNTNMFNEEDYKDLVEQAQPVKGIDPSHTWDLTKQYYQTVEVGNVMPEATRLQILTDNPVTGEGATILGDYPLSGNGKEYAAFIAPNNLTTFYAALVDDDDNYTVTSFTSDKRAINFSNPLATRVKVNTRQISRQVFSYCFEDEMPVPGDYDYNDVVLRISQERTAYNQITLDVTLAAVGSLMQVAAAIRFISYNYDDIESVTTVDDETFDKGYKKSALPFIESNDLLIKGLNGEAVINLFEDAHWATGVARYASEGYLPRYRYNVAKMTSADDDMMTPRTISYVITFKNPLRLNYFTLGELDPFVILEYNGILMEEHAVYKYKTVTALHEYVQPTGATILPWALVVPSASFRYPLNGVNIGYANEEGALFGAYMTEKHAFGEWAAKAGTAHDWYFYPTGNMVY